MADGAAQVPDADRVDALCAVLRRHNVVRVKSGEFELELGPPGLPPGAHGADLDDEDEDGVDPFRYAASGMAPRRGPRKPEAPQGAVVVERAGEVPPVPPAPGGTPA